MIMSNVPFYKDLSQLPRYFISGTPDLHEDVPVDDSELARLLNLIYKENPRTHLAESDLSILASDSVNPEVANWVRTQLLRPQDFGDKSIYQGHQVDDDTIMDLTRNSGESVDDYFVRVRSYVDNLKNS